LPEKSRDLIFLKEHVEEGRIYTLMDRTYSMDQVAEAYRYVDSGHKKGNVVITLEQCN